MSKKSLITIGILVFAALSIGWQDQTQNKPALRERFQEFKQELEEKKAQGYNVSEAENLLRQAREARQKGDREKAKRLLKEAFEALERAKPIAVSEETAVSIMPEAVKEEARRKLSHVKVASVYETVSDSAVVEKITGGKTKRSTDDVVRFFKETKTDFIFRGFWRWNPCPDSPNMTSNRKHILRGYTYEQLEQAISKIKKETPGVIFCSGIPSYVVFHRERNPITGETFDKADVWEMALDPRKWGIDVSKEDFQKKMEGITTVTVNDGYYPDITNPDFQELLLSWAKKQIDVGADAIWVDLLFTQAARLYGGVTGDIYHPAVKESYEAASKIVDEIHKYGESKGKYIYVGTWAYTQVQFPYPAPNLDFVTESVSSDEISQKKLDENKWNDRVNKIRERYGNIPIFVFIDWGWDTAPLAKFSQELNKEEQRQMLRKMDEFFQTKGVIFVYPIHGGWMGKSATKLSFGKWRSYDSLAPEFETYETIKELAQSKKQN